MELSLLRRKMGEKAIPHFLIFTGEEWLVQQKYIEQIGKIVSLPIKPSEAMTGIYSTIQGRGFIKKPAVYVLRDDPDIIGNEKLQAQIKAGLVKDDYLIMLWTSVDKRTKLYKQFQESIIEFNKLDDMILRKYISQEIPLNENNLTKLIDVCEHDYGRCLLEIDKIKRFDHEATNSAFEHLLADGTIYTPPKDAIFDMVEAVMRHQVNKSFDLLEQCYAIGEAALVMLSVLYNTIKQTLQVQSCPYTDNKQIEKSTGLLWWQVKNAKERSGKYSNGELVRGLRKIQEVEKSIKSGQIDEEYAMEFIILELL